MLTGDRYTFVHETSASWTDLNQYFAEAQWTMERKLLASWSYRVALARLILRRPKNRPIWLRCLVEFAVIIDLHTADCKAYDRQYPLPNGADFIPNEKSD